MFLLFLFSFSLIICVPGWCAPTIKFANCSKTSLSCSSASGDEEDLEPGVKAVREKERRQANNARERYLEDQLSV